MRKLGAVAMVASRIPTPAHWVRFLAALPLLVVGCASAQPAAQSAECAAIRSFYDHAQTKLLDSGTCDDAPSASECVPHIALREAFIASLKENSCPSEQSPSKP